MSPSPLPQADLRQRAIRLLTAFFDRDDERARRHVFAEAFSSCPAQNNPANNIEYSGSVALFASAAVDALLAFGCATRGKHALALLLETMANTRGRQLDPGFHDLPRLLNEPCTLPTRAEECEYLESLIARIAAKARLYSPLGGKAVSRPARLGPQPWRGEAGLDLFLRLRPAKPDQPEHLPTRGFSDILTAFAEVNRAVLLGGPGSGKSTTLRKLAHQLALNALADPSAPLPLLVDLGSWTGGESLSDFLAHQCPQLGPAVEALARRRRLALLLDGLNEVPTQQRAAKAAGINQLFKRLEQLDPQAPLVGSCRAEDYVGDLNLGVDTLTLEPLTPQRIRAALHKWTADLGQPEQDADRLFWQLAGDERLAALLQKWLDAGATEESFWTVSHPKDEDRAFKATTGQDDQLWLAHIPNPRSLLKLASNPYMLTMLFLVWRDEGRLPANRGGLFRSFVYGLLGREGLCFDDPQTGQMVSTPECEQLLAGLVSLAWQMQTGRVAAGPATSGDFNVLTVVDSSVAIQAIGSQVLLKTAQDATLLEGATDIRFRHQLLQEYFTAQALLDRMPSTPATTLWPPGSWWERSGWEEAAVLLAGLFPDDCTRVMEWLIPAQPEVAARCLLESGAAVPSREALLHQFRETWFSRLTDIHVEPAPEARAAIGRALGRLGLDHRPGVGLRSDGLPDIDWVQIPASEFIYQEGERRRCEAFSIARYPITNAQFQAFMDDSLGYGDDRWWKGLGNPDRTPEASSWTEPNHPRTEVSWNEAMAYCRWVAQRLKQEVRLPTEWEWERAARGVDEWQFPWGGEYKPGYANIRENDHYLARTSPVGIYPQGASPEGVLDLAGNVWEWCFNEYRNPDNIGPSGGQSRVLRGGSWVNLRDYARAAYRNDHDPDLRNYDIGFRVVVASPIRKR